MASLKFGQNSYGFTIISFGQKNLKSIKLCPSVGPVEFCYFEKYENMYTNSNSFILSIILKHSKGEALDSKWQISTALKEF